MSLTADKEPDCMPTGQSEGTGWLGIDYVTESLVSELEPAPVDTKLTGHATCPVDWAKEYPCMQDTNTEYLAIAYMLGKLDEADRQYMEVEENADHLCEELGGKLDDLAARLV